MFIDRKDAGNQLAKIIKTLSLQKALVVGLPRGGVVVAAAIAKELHKPLEVIIPRKIGAPLNPELAIGALVGDEIILDQDLIDTLAVSENYLKNEIAKEKKEAKRREILYRKGKNKISYKGSTVIIVDDGIATGATMRASLRFLQKQGAKRCIVAVPVGPKETVQKFKEEGVEVVCLYTPESFFAVGQFYEQFEQVEDQQVIELLHDSY